MKNFSSELIELVGEHCLSSRDLACLSLVNGHFYSSIIRLLYRDVMINNPRQYLSFKAIENKELKRLVRRLDFSSYTTRGSRWSEEKAKSIILGQELALLIGDCNQLKELFVGEEMMHAFVSHQVIRSIFNQDNKLSTIDFTGFCDRNFTTVMADFFKPVTLSKSELKHCDFSQADTLTTNNWSVPPRLQNISFYMCMALSQEHFFIPFFEKLAKNGNRLSRLDLGYTQITSDVFTYLKGQESSLTHLNLQGCHSLTCCSPLIDFIKGCSNLVQLNINMEFNGIGGSRFCHECIFTILNATNHRIESLDMGGHVNFDDSMLISEFPNLTQLSLTYCKNISIEKLVSLNTPKLYYLNLSRTPLTMDIDQLPRVLEQLAHLKVIEISPFTPKKYPPVINKKWKLSIHGRRTFYSQGNINPMYAYSKKLLLLDNQVLSPMVKYWCYSY
ncbi:hypothetical protein INT47_001788 [Mucor saturninus]|uniref:Uncharacterized protein n=1 Tax=Mucor saturninus TaxID=64648 RepID=A0A8H7QU17_9FUNG|nr:hypothetical protein INT47_001788 [Mucor saturninus]